MRWVSLALLFSSCLLAQQAGIQGVVTDAVTRQPMAGVHVTLRTVPAIDTDREDTQTYGAISRPDGHFSIADLKPGVYYLIAQRNGYVQLPKKKPSDATITLKPGEQIHDLTVELTQHAVIVGHVLDEFGDPVQDVQVSAESNGRGGSGGTDERGQFRISLPPGKYYVQAQPNPLGRPAMMGPPEIRSDGVVPAAYATTFYPSAATSDKATALELAPGQSVSGIDIHLTPKRSVTVRGRVIGIPTDQEHSAYVVMSGTVGDQSLVRPAFTEPDGTFAIPGLIPGKYRLTAQFNVADGPNLQSASVEVDAEADENNVVLALVHGETMSGTIEFEGEAPKPGGEKLSVRLNLQMQFGENKGADVDDSGAFHVDGIFPGKIHVSVMPLPENAYVKSIRLGAEEAQNGLVDLSRGVAGAQIHITLSRNGGRVEGKVLSDDRQPFAGAALAVLSESPDGVDDKGIQSVEPGKNFSFSGLHPGKYWIMALDPAQFMGGRDGIGAVKALLVHGQQIEIHEGDRITKDLKITRVESADAKQ